MARKAKRGITRRVNKQAPITIRTVQPEDIPFLREMLFEAAAVSETMRILGIEKALALPANRKYLEAWGRPGDAGVVAQDTEQKPLGAAWYRLFPIEAPGYGFISPAIPELTMSVHADARGQGIGRALLQALIDLARTQEYSALSLSVDRNNAALRLYERLGFHDAGISIPGDTSVTMVKYLA